MKPLVYIIILNWNGWKDTLNCLESVVANTYPNYRVVVCDNSSTDSSLEQIRSWASAGKVDFAEYSRADWKGHLNSPQPSLTLISTGGNLGFAGGNNVGISYALNSGADYVWLLNNDTEVQPQSLEKLVEAGEQDPSAGILGSKIYHLEQRDKLLFTGGRLNWPCGLAFHLTKQEDGEPGQVDYITGCSMLVKCSIIPTVGLMEEEFFLYYEDADWCVRVKKAGFGVVYVPQSMVYHKESSSTGALTPVKQYYCTRNNLVFMKRQGKWYLWITFLPFFLLKVIIKGTIFILRGRPGLLKYLGRGLADFFGGKLGNRL